MHLSVKPTLVAAFAAAALFLSGCGLDPRGGYRPMNQAASGSVEGVSFNEANARCWEASMNIAGFAATVPQQNAYDACMKRHGWQDSRMPARSQPSAPSGR